MFVIVDSVVGRKLRCRLPDQGENPEKLLEYTTAVRPKVTINGKRGSLGDLVRGDQVELRNISGTEGVHDVIVTRDETSPVGIRTRVSNDLSVPLEIDNPKARPDVPETATNTEDPEKARERQGRVRRGPPVAAFRPENPAPTGTTDGEAEGDGSGDETAVASESRVATDESDGSDEEAKSHGAGDAPEPRPHRRAASHHDKRGKK